MKKVWLTCIMVVGFVFVINAQDTGPTSQGKWLIEANTGFGDQAAHGASTGFGLSTSDGSTLWSIGFEGGYFIIDDLALKAGLGYTDFDGSNLFSYKLGAKYYIISKIPVQLDITGASISDFDENPLWLGLQAGYAIFLNDFVSVEPGIRYNLSLNEQYSEDGIFEFKIGFALHF